MKWIESEWFERFRLGVKITLVAAALYVAYTFYVRSQLALVRPREAPVVDLHDDLYVHPKKSYVSDFESAKRRLAGTPLWVKEGYRWPYEPGGRLFEPLEKIVPGDVVSRGGSVYLVFEKDGKPARVAVGSPERVYVDEMFFIEDPRALYDHWTNETWAKVENHEVEAGMSEFQITFALGAGQLVRQSANAATRVVDYAACLPAGCEPIRVTYKRNVSQSIEPLQPADE